jgi:hypothetical protein
MNMLRNASTFLVSWKQQTTLDEYGKREQEQKAPIS